LILENSTSAQAMPDELPHAPGMSAGFHGAGGGFEMRYPTSLRDVVLLPLPASSFARFADGGAASFAGGMVLAGPKLHNTVGCRHCQHMWCW